MTPQERLEISEASAAALRELLFSVLRSSYATGFCYRGMELEEVLAGVSDLTMGNSFMDKLIKMRQCLEFYANPGNWEPQGSPEHPIKSVCELDRGVAARKARVETRRQCS